MCKLKHGLSAQQIAARLPLRPWHINVFQDDGDTNYQVQASDGQVVANLFDSEFEAPGAARAVAEFICNAANAEECARCAGAEVARG